MPRSGSGIYSKPAGTTAVPNTTITSSQFNTTIDDIAADLNYPRPIVNGGTGATSASSARVSLGLEIGVNIQAYDAGLQSISGLVTSENQMIYTTASDVFAATSLTPFSRTILDDADASTMRETLGANDASNLTDGTLNDDRLSGDYSFGSLTLADGLTLGTSLSIANGGTNATTVEAARANLAVYSKDEIDTRLAEQGSTPIDASRLTTGVISDQRLPARLADYPAEYADGLGIIADYDLATKCGNYYAPATAAHLPTVGVACIVGVSAATALTVRQDAFEVSTQRHWCRYGYDNSGVIVWTVWKPVYETADELLPVIDARIAANVPTSTVPNVLIFTSSGTYTKSSGISWVKITVIGGGGGGYSGSPSSGGGGAGGTAIKYAPSSEVGVTNSVIVGSGGNAGSGGGTSSIQLSSVMVSGSGGGSGGSASVAGGGGGNGSNGTINIPGGQGGGDSAGGNSIFLGGGRGGNSSGVANTGGGGGSGRSGGSGVVIVEEYF